MKRKQRIIKTIKTLIKESEETRAKIDELPKGYIQYKTVYNHRYAFRQWREGDKVKTEYINENFVAAIERKIKLRKTYARLLKDIKAEIKRICFDSIKQNFLSKEEVDVLVSKNMVS